MQCGHNPQSTKKSAGTYHVRVEGRRQLLGIKVIPVYGREEHVVLDLSLQKWNRRYIRYKINKLLFDIIRQRLLKSKCTYKVISEAQSLGSVFLQQAFQQVSGSVGYVGFELQRLVQDVVVHFRCVAAVERRLWRNHKNSQQSCKKPSTQVSSNSVKLANWHEVHLFCWNNSPGHITFHTALHPNTTSPPSGHTAACVTPPVPNTARQIEKHQDEFAYRLQMQWHCLKAAAVYQ